MQTYTVEDLAKLDGLVPFSAEDGDTFEYTPERFVNMKITESLRPIFELKLFTIEEQAKVPSNPEQVAKLSTEELLEIARKQVKGWKNLVSVKGKEIPYKSEADGGADSKLFARLPRVVVGDILFKLIRSSGLFCGDKLGLA